MRHLLLAALAALWITLPAHGSDTSRASLVTDEYPEEHPDDTGEGGDELLPPRSCRAATAAQKATVNRGNAKASAFLQRCLAATGSSPWCEQVMRPNPASRATFDCTYGPQQPHQLIHPDESTWTNAVKAVQLVQDLERLGVRVDHIYNWWRPEPYNANVGGAKGRHPLGTSVDVRFATFDDMEKAHRLLCDFRRRGRLRALGYYGTTGLHLGVGDTKANTWGKGCP